MFYLKYGKRSISIDIPGKDLLFTIAPNDIGTLDREEGRIAHSIKNPIGALPLKEEVESGMKVTILIDDLTRPTPQERILPIILRQLNEAGIKDKHITIIIALGTHEYMTSEEIIERVGKEVFNRVEVTNHEWKNKGNLVSLGKTNMGSFVQINKKTYESDYIIGVGSIVPHCQAGWSGGAKILQPGICSPETTAHTHMLSANRDCLEILGKETNPVRLAIEEVAQKAGLRFIVNVIVDSQTRLVDVVAGDFIKAQREGIKISRKVYERSIPALSDIIIVSANPGDIDYWQGIKCLAGAQRGLKEGGTIILLGSFCRGISSEHPEMEKYGHKSYQELEELLKNNEIKDYVNASTLFLHALILERSKIICISEGLSSAQKKNLGFEEAMEVKEALQKARKEQGRDSKIGIMDYGGDVLPVLK